jgi:two-component system osmolarity sensor histidine kinase EnvZ
VLKSFAPKSLYGRTIAIVVLPIFLMQSVVTYVFFNRHWEEVTSSLAKNTASDLGLLVLEWEEATSPQERARLIGIANRELDIEMGFFSGGTIPDEDQRSIFDALNRTLNRELDWSLDVPYWYDTRGFDDEVEIRVQLDDGYLRFRVDRERVVARNGHLFIAWLIGVTILLGYIALIFLRNQVRSITRLAAAADAFGRGQDVRGFKPSGAREVRLAGQAFLAMQSRIKRFLEQRTEMLAGVSHDLKTPLTRLRLSLALQPQNDDVRAMAADVAEMEQLLNAYLTFARGDALALPEPVELNQFLTEIAEASARSGRPIEVTVADNISFSAQAGNLRRAMSNLVDNAAKYGERVRLTGEVTREKIRLIVDDDGPGIAPEDRGEAMRAFSRLDHARNSNAPGSGLGLAIVRDVARAHGGSLELTEAPLGGLRAIVEIPR